MLTLGFGAFIELACINPALSPEAGESAGTERAVAAVPQQGAWETAPETIAVLPIVATTTEYLDRYLARVPAASLRVAYAARTQRLLALPSGTPLRIARRKAAERLVELGYVVSPFRGIDVALGARIQEGGKTSLAELGEWLGIDAFLFMWSDHYERSRALGIQRSEFTIVVRLVEAQTGAILWEHKGRRLAGYEVGDSDGDFERFVAEWAGVLIGPVPPRTQ